MHLDVVLMASTSVNGLLCPTGYGNTAATARLGARTAERTNSSIFAYTNAQDHIARRSSRACGARDSLQLDRKPVKSFSIVTNALNQGQFKKKPQAFDFLSA